MVRRMHSRGLMLSARNRNLVKKFGSKALWSFERTIAERSAVGDSALVDRAYFPWLADLEGSTASIRRELDGVLKHREHLPDFHEISADQRSITDDDKWKTYFFYGFGRRSDANCRRCPATAAVLSRIPGLVTAFFSILAPGKRIPAHRGVYKGLLRAHLGLAVPRPELCGMSIGNEMVRWREGSAFVFDDTYTHEAWNESDKDRVVLLVDVLRPLPRPVQLLNRALVGAVALSPYVTDGEKNQRAWEARFERLTR